VELGLKPLARLGPGLNSRDQDLTRDDPTPTVTWDEEVDDAANEEVASSTTDGRLR